MWIELTTAMIVTIGFVSWLTIGFLAMLIAFKADSSSKVDDSIGRTIAYFFGGAVFGLFTLILAALCVWDELLKVNFFMPKDYRIKIKPFRWIERPKQDS